MAKKELDFAKRLAREAGGLIATNFKKGVQKTWKADGTPLTETDTAVNRLVIERVLQAFPDHGVLGEEESANTGAEYKWVCDPIDGTMPFSHGLPISTFSLALTKEGQPLLGVVYDPYMDRLFSASVGDGAFLNDQPIQAEDRTDLKNALIDLEGFPNSSDPILKIKSGLEEALSNAGAHLTKYWSVILPGALVASGQFTATIFNVKKPEDGAAIKVIIEEAGGKVTDLFGNERRFDQPGKGYVASCRGVHQQLLDIISQHTELI